MTDLQYPTGRFVLDSTPTPETRQLHIEANQRTTGQNEASRGRIE